jgi:putative intracellular protease/amidase
VPAILKRAIDPPARHALREEVIDGQGREAVVRWRIVVGAAAAVLVGLLASVAVAAVGIARASDQIYATRDASMPPAPVVTATPTAHDRSKPTAVILLSLQGTNVADVLAPYEVFADTGAFNLYTVAEQRRSVPLTGGVDLIPDLSFADLEKRLPTGPDVIVVPQLNDAGEPSAYSIVQWLQQQRRRGSPLLVSVCVGAEVLASAGLLDGRPATSHWLGLIGLRRSYPSVQWQDGVRYVDDGDVITSAGVLSGVDATLRVVERMLGPTPAQRAAVDVAWPDYSPGVPAPIPLSKPAAADAVGLLSGAYRWDRPRMGVLVTDGLGEIELAAAFRLDLHPSNSPQSKRGLLCVSGE